MIFMRKISWMFLFLVSALTGIFIFLLNTSTGIHLIFKGITYFIPGLVFDSVIGNWKHFNLFHVEYRVSTGTMRINKCEVILNYKYLFNRQLCVEYLFAQDIFINMNDIHVNKKEIIENTTIRISNIFSFFHSLICKKIMLFNTRIVSNHFVCELKAVENSGIIVDKNRLLKILSTHIREGYLNVSAIDVLSEKKIYQYFKFWNINGFLKKISAYNVGIILPKIDIPLDIVIEGVQGQDLYFGINNNHCKVDNFLLQLSLFDQVSNMNLEINLLYGRLHLVGYVMFKENWPINITTNCTIFDTKRSNNDDNQNIKKINLVIQGALADEVCLLCDFTNVVSTVHMLLKIRITQFGIPVNILIVGRKIPLFFFRRDKYIIEKIDFSLNGNMRNYSMRIISQLIDMKNVLVHIVLDATGNFNEYIISKLSIESLNTFFEIKGAVRWNNMIVWNSVLRLHKFNMLKKIFKGSVALSGVVACQGCVYPDTSWTLKVSDINISGCDTRNNRIFCTGSIYKDVFGRWKVPGLLMRWGRNELLIKGNLRKNYDFDIIFKIPRCDSIIPVLHGSIYSRFKIYGSVQSPILFSTILLRSLHWDKKNFFINKLIFNSKIDCNLNMLGNFFLKADEIQYSTIMLNQLVVKGQGNAKQHNVNITFCNNEISCGKINFFGNFDFLKKIWSGRFYDTNIITLVGIWKLSHNVIVKYQYAERKVIIDSHYWESINCCVPMQDIYRINILKKINKIFFRYLDLVSLKTDSSLEAININVARIYCMNCVWVVGELLPRGTILVAAMPLYVKYFNGIEIIAKKLKSVHIKIILREFDISCQWHSTVINDSVLYGALRINCIHDVPEISGSIHVNNFLIEFFSDLLFQSKKYMQGLMNVNIRFCGSIHAPKIYGSMEFQNVKFSKFDVPFVIKNSKLVVNFFESCAVLHGFVETDNGKYLYINGNIYHVNSIRNMKMFITLKGDQVDLFISPEIQLKISPNIVCTITTKKICIQGTVDIPQARIVIQELSHGNTVSISSEEIILDENFNSISEHYKRLSIFLSSNIAIFLGNDVNFDGFGFHVKLTGNVVAGYDKNGLMLTGHVDIPSGYCMIYGHDLVIKKGQLLFYGKASQPYLDIEAMHNTSTHVGTVIKGIRITGTLDRPKVEIFPNVSLFSSREMVSYLLKNHSVVSSYTDANIITSLLVGASVSYNEKFINKIGRIFGVQHLTVYPQNIGANPLVVLSGFIAPGLQVKYELSIFDLLSTITVRYCIYSKFYLEVTSGNHQAFDVLYQFGF